MTAALLIMSMLMPMVISAPQGERRTSEPSAKEDDTGLATLHALDPLSRTLCLRDGQPGGRFQGSEVRNRCSDIDFNSYNSGSFTVAIEGTRLGNIVDLGTADDLMKKYGYPETVGKGQGFASLRVEDDKVVILKDQSVGTVQELEEGRGFLGASRTGASAAVRLAHIYLVHLTDRNDKSFKLMAKLIVVDYRPNESVTIRWQLL